MRTLAFDTSCAQGSVALLENEKILASETWTRTRAHGEPLTGAICRCLESAEANVASVDRIAVGVGPGSFTGVRSAVNVARTLAYAANKSVYAFDTTEILVAELTQIERPVLLAINASRNLAFVTSFIFQGQHWVRRLPIAAVDPDSLVSLIDEPHLCIGDAFTSELAASLASPLFIFDANAPASPSAETLGRMASQTSANSRQMVWNEIQALYIRSSGAEENLSEARRALQS